MKNAIALTCLLLLIGCGDQSGNPSQSLLPLKSDVPSPEATTGYKTHATCDSRNVPTSHLCVESIGSLYNDADYISMVQSSCDTISGTFTTDPCSLTGAVGRCVIDAGLESEVRTAYFPPDYTQSSAQQACASNNGIFTAL